MAVEANLGVIRRLVEEGWNEDKLEVVNELVAEDAVRTPEGDSPGRQAWKDEISFFRSAFPDLRIDIDDQFGVGDKVVLRCTGTGTDTIGFMERPPTGRRVSVTTIIIYRVTDGVLVEQWAPSADVSAEIIQQLS